LKHFRQEEIISRILLGNGSNITPSEENLDPYRRKFIPPAMCGTGFYNQNICAKIGDAITNLAFKFRLCPYSEQKQALEVL
jgi:hypothetical protein